MLRMGDQALAVARRAEREVVVLVPRESRQIEHDHEMDTALVQTGIREQALKLVAVRGLGTLALFRSTISANVFSSSILLIATASL